MVCHSGRIKGQPGVAMDDLIYICTKLARQMDAQVPREAAAQMTSQLCSGAPAAYVTVQSASPHVTSGRS